MVECAVEDLVVLHLDHSGSLPDADPVPYRFSIPGIGESLESGDEVMADRISLLSALSTLAEEGLVAESTREVRGLAGERNVYALTEAGSDRARRLRETLGDHEIRVENGVSTTIELREVGRYLDEPALVRALVSLTDDDVLYLEEGTGEGFVDRTAELAALEQHLDAVGGGDGRALLLAGEAGVGKTTLVAELLARVQGREFRVLEAVCRRDAAAPYAPFRDALAAHVDPDRLGRLFEGGPEAEDPASFTAQRKTLFADVVDAVEDLASESPVALFVDDLHLAADPTVALFEALATDLADAPVLLVGAYRPEDLPAGHPLAGVADDWTGDAGRRVIELSPFDRPATRELLAGLVGTRELPARFVELVYEQTGGNPLFVTESTRQMLEDGTVDPAEGVYPGTADAIPVPAEVEAAVDARLEVLDGAAERLLALGGLIGETIPVAVLAAASDLPDPEFRTYVDLLVDSHVWERVDDDRLRFPSGLVRETVVDRLDDDRRRRLHREIATAVTDVGRETDREYAARAAHHYRNAGADREALEHYLAAADHARDVYAHEAAVRNYERALSVARDLDDGPAELSVLEELARVKRVLGEYEDADGYFETVEQRADDPALRQRVARLRSRMEATRGDYDRAIEHAEEGLALADEGDTPEECRLLAHKGWALMEHGEFDEAEGVLDRAHGMAERLDEPELRALTLHNRATLDMNRGTPDAGTVEMFEEAAAIRERTGDREGLAETYNNLGITHIQRNDLDAGELALRRCLDIWEEMGNRPDVLTGLGNLGKLYERTDDYERALDTYRRVLDEGRAIGARQSVANALGNIGNILYQQYDDPEGAIDHLERSLAIQRELDNTRWQALVNRNIAKVHATLDDLPAAREHARRAVDLATEAGIPAKRMTALRVLADVETRCGDHGPAIDHLETALSVAADIDKPVHEVWIGSYLVEPYAETGQLDAAEAHLDRAAATLDDRLADLDDWRADELSAMIDTARGRYHRARGEYEEAVEALHTAIEQARALEMDDEDRAEIWYELGETERDRDNTEVAAESFDRARELATDVGAALWARRSREALDELRP